ncbi:MAG: glycosyltransferase family 2 protein [Ruminococcaceae bacterium]|nr:glycosyltransferase family 2 protein [Oscillospiraceae bacterium]
MEKEKWKIDVPVYMIFFNRPDTLAEVFAAVKKAKPSKLFLACDGPRDGNKADEEAVAQCKEIVSDITWDCEVYRNYSDVNLGCGMRMYSGIEWAFETVDRLIILEDDCVPSQAFFPFCQELLERYKDDVRIHSINAMNHLGVYEDTPYSYFFGRSCCCGWATWKRTWDNVDFHMSFLDDPYALKCVESKYPYYDWATQRGMERKKQLDEGKRLTAWTYQSAMACALYEQICIVPKYNMITNIGMTGNGVRSVNDVRVLPKKSRAYFDTKRYEIEFPLKHPKYVVEDRMYYDKVTKQFKLGFFGYVELVIRRLLFGGKKGRKK